jgi:hypothetical protein
MKKGLLILSTALAVLVLAVSAWGCGSFSSGSDISQSNVSQQNNGIWVTGIGKVTVTPDVAVVSLGVQAQALTVADAQAQTAKATRKQANKPSTDTESTTQRLLKSVTLVMLAWLSMRWQRQAAIILSSTASH